MNKRLTEIKNHYWICEECAEKAGGKFPEGHVCTVTVGTCKSCGSANVMLIPWVDFDWPNLMTKHLRD